MDGEDLKKTKDRLPSTSQDSNPDNNANLGLANKCNGAIPKIIKLKKTNNNDEVKLNGFGKNVKHGNILSAECLCDIQSGTASGNKRDIDARRSMNIPIVETDSFHGVLNTEINFLDLGLNSREPANNISDSSSDDNELLSISDDGCIYTYKGDQAADLPSSFFNLEIPLLDEPQGERREDNSSPEMDFLEMDFDPGPSGDADSDSISNAEIDNAASLPLDPKTEPIEEPQPCCSKDLNKTIQTQSTDSEKEENTQKNKYVIFKLPPEPVKEVLNISTAETKMPWSCSLSERTRAAKTLRVVKKHLGCRGELSSPIELALNGDVNIANLTSFHLATGKILIDDKNSVSSSVERNMIWTHQEACLKQITQVGPSACGATAVLNVLNALRFPIPTIERVQECVSTRLRANTSPLTEYLLSRSNAGCTHRDLIAGLYELSDKKIYSRFFSMYPERVVNLPIWLSYWIKHGAVPIATLNLQKCDGTIPDSWHHQMIFGVGSEGIYLTNPLEIVDPNQLWPQLSSESVLLVRSDDVISRWNQNTDLPQLIQIDDVRWKKVNVVGQVARIVRESRQELRADASASHIKIPAEYKAGITLALNMNSPAFALLRQCPELPLLSIESSTASAF